MELNFAKKDVACLDAVLREVQNSEQTQTIQIPDGLPDVGKVLAAWGQCIQRGKEWRGGSIGFTGGMMVWVLYAPEDGGREICIDGWIPFQMQWELPGDTPEGDIRMKCLTRFVDARSVSPRKLLVRAGMGVLAEAWAPKAWSFSQPAGETRDVELLQNTYPVRLPKEAGEKTFLIDEELTLPDTLPQPDKLVYYRMEPVITERKVLSGKLVFRGNSRLHILYRSGEGSLQSWDTELSFSQFAELREEHSTDAQAELLPGVTSLEAEISDEGRLRLKAGAVAQYLISDLEPLTVVEDAYSPGRETELQRESLEVPALLESRRETLNGEQTLGGETGTAVDVVLLPDFPREIPTETGVELEVPLTAQVLFYGEDGALRSGTARWEARQSLPSSQDSRITALPGPGEIQVIPSPGGFQLRSETALDCTASASRGIPMVTGVTLGDVKQKDPARPSLILRRAGAGGLWDIAKSAGSTVEAIRQANALQSEPAPGQMLLIPVP